MVRSKASVAKKSLPPIQGGGKTLLPQKPKKLSVMATLLEGRRKGRFRGVAAAGRRIRREIKRSGRGGLCFSRALVERCIRQALDSEFICPLTKKVVKRLGHGVVDYIRQAIETDITRDNAVAQRMMINEKHVTLTAAHLKNSRDIAALYHPNAFRVDSEAIAKEFGLVPHGLVTATVGSVPHCVEAMKSENQKKREASAKRRRRAAAAAE